MRHNDDAVFESFGFFLKITIQSNRFLSKKLRDTREETAFPLEGS